MPKKGWVGAIDLRAGDILVLQSGEYVVVELIQHEILESPIKVYNFEVKDFHTYYVSESAVLVHNACGQRNTPDQDALIKIAKDMKKTGLSRAEAEIMSITGQQMNSQNNVKTAGKNPSSAKNKKSSTCRISSGMTTADYYRLQYNS